MPGLFDDMSDEEFDKTSAMDKDEFKAYQIQKNAHIVNGGETTFPCPSCKGSGYWRGTYGAIRQCFKCNGGGKVSARVAGAAKGKETKTRNFKIWCDENCDLITRLQRHQWNKFVKSMLEQIESGQALSIRQVEAVTDAVNRYDAADVLRAERKRAEQAAKSGPIGLDAINTLFQVALDSGKKAPMFRAKIGDQRIVISIAKRHANRLYVKDGMREATYLGKIEGGQYIASREAPSTIFGLLCEIASDPVKAAKDYGHSTGTCCFCARPLTDDKSGRSVEMGYGPICAERFGLDWG